MRATTRVAVVLLLAAGCSRFEELAPGTVVTCQTAADCPSGRVCNRNRCILPSELGSPPDLVLTDGKLAITPPSGRAGTAFTVTVVATKELEAPPRVILSLDTLVELPCTATAARTYACSYTATGAERGGLGGRVTIDVRMVDLVGQEAVKNGVGGFDLDFSPPVLAARSVAPASVALGSTLQVFFTTDEDLGENPVLVASRRLDEPGDGTRFTLTRQPGTRNYLFTHVVTIGDGAGPVDFTVDLTDVAGNHASVVPVGSLVVDPVPPTISSLAAAPERLPATGTLTVTFEASEAAAPGTLAVTVGGRSLTCGPFSAASPSYTCTRAMAGDEIAAGAEAVQSVVVALADAAGNRSTASGSVVFDFKAPALSARSAGPASVPLGGTLVVSLTPDEELGANPVLVASRALDEPGGTRFTLTRQPGTRNYQFTHVVTAADPPGTVTFTAEATDLVGNAATGLAVGSVVLDNVVPAISSVTASPARLGTAGTLTVTFSSTEQAAAGTLAVTVGGRAMTCGAYSAIPPSYTCTRAMAGNEIPAGTEAAQSISVSLADAAGNRAAASGSAVVFDFKAPALAGSSAEPANVPFGGVILVSFTPDEDLGANPVLVASRALDDPGGTRFSLTPQPGTRNYLFTHLVTTGDASGPVTFAAELTDLVGNAAAGVPVGSVVLDTVVPVISAVQVSPARIDATGVVTVSFNSTEDGAVAVTVGGRAMACGGRSGSSPNYTCTRTMVGNEIPAGTEASQAVAVTLTDAAGNRGTGGGTIVFDFRPPGVATATVAYTPPAGSPLAIVARATTGARVTASVLADEVLDPAMVPSLVAGLGARTLSFAYLPAASTSTSAVFETVVPAGLPDGDYLATVTWVDLAGNRAATSTNVPRVRLKTSAPTLVVDQNALTFVRSPQGNAAPEALGAYTIPAGPYFAVEPSDVLATATTLPAGSLRLADGGTLASVIVQSPSTPAVTLGVLMPDGFGRIPRQALLSPDVTGARLVGLDDAGNRSAAVRLQTAEWVASSNRPVGVSGHQVSTLPSAHAARALPANAATASGTEDLGADGTALIARGGVQWASRDPARNEGPPGRAHMGVAYDALRGRIVMFSGYAFSRDGNIRDTWEWDGSSWHDLTPPPGVGPSARQGHAMAYDAARGVTVLFGGDPTSGGALQDTWEWDGETWRDATPAGLSPPARWGARMVFDTARGRCVLFGGSGFQDTWEWDGTNWWNVTPASVPPARYDFGAAYDSLRAVTVIFGGWGAGGALQDTWEWNGTTWTQRFPVARPPAREALVMTYDAARGRTVMLGGEVGTPSPTAVWQWDGTSWTSVTPAGSTPLFGPSAGMVYDAVNRSVLLFGGRRTSSSDYSQTQVWDGTSWTLLGADTTGPTWRHEFAMAFDAERDHAVVFGGKYFRPGAINDSRLGDTWEWDGSAWVDKTPATGGPVPRWGHVMAYDSFRRRTVLFGGTASTGAAQDTWEWDGTAWTTLTPVGPPTARRYAAMAYDSSRRRMVLFGGSDAGGVLLQDTWEYDGTRWWGPLSSTNAPPPARSRHAMAYDAARGVVLLFGGADASGVRQDTWTWNGTTWTQLAPAGALPASRSTHALAYDSGRSRVLLTGGTAATGTFVDLWEWNGTAWTDITPTGIGPSARSGPGLVFDSRRGRAVMFGGNNTENVVVWEVDARTARIPAVQLDASFVAAGFRTADILGMRARAWAGGVSGAGAAGAVLEGWGSLGTGSSYPGWIALGANSAGLGSAPPANFVGWTASSATDARRFVTQRDGRLSFRVRPSASAGTSAAGASVGLDYFEVRVRYTAP